LNLPKQVGALFVSFRLPSGPPMRRRHARDPRRGHPEV